MKINQMEKTTNNQINKKEEIRILSRITPVPDICDHQNVEGQNGYFSLKKGWFVFLTFVFMNHTVQLSQTRVCPSPQYRPINFSSLQFILEWNILFLFFLFFVSRLAVSTISFQEFAQTSQSSFSAVFENILGLVESDFIKIGRNQHLDRVFVPIFRQIFGEQVRFHLPSRKSETNDFMTSAVKSPLAGLYLVISSSKWIRRMAGSSSFFMPKNSKIRWWSSSSVSTVTNRTFPLNSLATVLASVLILPTSAWLLPTKISRWFLTSPPKIF